MKTVKILSHLACLLVIESIRIVPQESEISEDDYAKLLKNEDFNHLLKNGRIQVIEGGESLDNFEEVDPTKMKVSELKVYAEKLGITIPEDAKKADILKLIELGSEE